MLEFRLASVQPQNGGLWITDPARYVRRTLPLRGVTMDTPAYLPANVRSRAELLVRANTSNSQAHSLMLDDLSYELSTSFPLFR